MLTFRDERIQIIFVSFALIVLGFVYIYSIGALQANRIGKMEYFFLFKQLTSAMVGIFIMYIGYRIPLDRYRSWIPFLYLLTLILLVLVFFFKPVNGANRWIPFPIFSFQPSELAKIVMVIYFAHYLDKKEDKIQLFSKGIFPASVMLGVMISLILLEPDFGTTILIITVSFILLFIGGMDKKYIIVGVLIVIPVALTFILMAGYRKARLVSFLNPWEYKNTFGYQLIQSLVAIGSGGVTGKGLGNSSQKLFFLPEAHTDFVFAIISEELGFIGSLFFIILILYLFILTYRIAMRHYDKYKRFLTLGFGFMILIQSFIHIGVTVGILPTKGITLPFVSYGGSALIAQMFIVGILMRSAEETK
ncbi:MAG: putative lipid II flippase FtsW [Calditerrivibrio sp.]|uniref:putative lipid II flippase FtsW n=1 Tax=Calditerrivibrio sp. TaxID=2792612 RepID=UPI003D0E7065